MADEPAPPTTCQGYPTDARIYDGTSASGYPVTAYAYCGQDPCPGHYA